jgi:YD repeat-containing protein
MNDRKKIVYLASQLLVILLLINACESNKSNEQPLSACKLMQITSSKSLATGELSNSNSTFQYDNSGRIVASTETTEEKDNKGQTTSSSNTSGSQVYDLNGYLTKSTSESSFIDGSSQTDYTYENTYQYQEGHLIKENSVSSTAAYAYEYDFQYDNNWNLTKYVSSISSGDFVSTNTFDFVTKKITMIAFTGGETDGELDANGYVLKEVNLAGVERRYQYDNAGNLIREEEWVNSKLDNAVEYQYDDKINPTYKFGNSSLKGMPELKIYRVIWPIHNYTKETHYNVDQANQEVVSSTIVYNIKYNASGYATSITASERDAQSNLVSTKTTTYTYQDCK